MRRWVHGCANKYSALRLNLRSLAIIIIVAIAAPFLTPHAQRGRGIF
jgi:hypothetical protein